MFYLSKSCKGSWVCKGFSTTRFRNDREELKRGEVSERDSSVPTNFQGVDHRSMWEEGEAYFRGAKRRQVPVTQPTQFPKAKGNTN